MNDLGQIVGLLTQDRNYVLAKGSLHLLPAYPGAQTTYYCCQNTQGTVAGNYIPAGDFDGTEFGFVYRNGAFAAVPYSGLFETPTISGLNNSGIAVGTIDEVSGEYGFTFYNGVLRKFSHPGSEFTMFYGINGKGQIVGTFSSDIASSGFFIYDEKDRSERDQIKVFVEQARGIVGRVHLHRSHAHDIGGRFNPLKRIEEQSLPKSFSFRFIVHSQSGERHDADWMVGIRLPILSGPSCLSADPAQSA